jgi:hypothetical protein
MPVSLLSRDYPFLLIEDFEEARNDIIIDHKSVILLGRSYVYTFIMFTHVSFIAVSLISSKNSILHRNYIRIVRSIL